MNDELLKARCWAEIDLDLIKHNYITAVEENSPARVICVLKADAYGTGAVRVCEALQSAGADFFAVADLEEALELRTVTDKDILVMGWVNPIRYEEAIENDIIMTAVDLASAREMDASAVRLRKKARAHVKLDTGLHRLGFDCEERDDIAEAYRLNNLSVEGIFTHLALRNRDSDRAQIAEYLSVVERLRKEGIDPGMTHALDSIGMLLFPEYRFDAVRAGAWLYGSWNAHFPDPSKCPLAVKLKARVAQVRNVKAGDYLGYDEEHPLERDSVIATLAIGYYDGIPRAVNKGEVVIKGRRARIVGLVMMDQCTIDVTGIDGVEPGDEVTFLGDGISLLEASKMYSWNRNELIARMSRRVKRVYIG